MFDYDDLYDITELGGGGTGIPDGGTDGQVLTKTSSVDGEADWEDIPAGHAAVTLDVNADTLLSLSTQALGLDTQVANTVLAGRVDAGAAAVPTFRALVAADIPSLVDTYLALDQTSAKTIVNGVPLMTTAVDIDGSGNQLVNKTYVDTALLGLELTEFFSTVNSAVADGLGGFHKIMDNTVQVAGTNTSASYGTGNDQFYRGYITPVGSPNLNTLYAGAYNIRGNLYKTGTKSVTVYGKLYQRTSGGVETLIATSDTTAALTTTSTPFNITLYLSTNYTLDTTDRLVMKFYANVGASGGDVTIKTDVGGSTSAGLTIKAPAIDVESLATAISFSCIAGEALLKGQAVYISGASSGLPQVSLADCTDSTKCRVVGLVTEDLANTAIGKVRRNGVLIGVDSQTTGNVNSEGGAWSAGELVFLSTGGKYTTVRPTSGRSVKVGFTLVGDSASDSILVYPFENPVWHTAAANEDNVVRLGDTAGVNKLSIRDYANAEVAYIDSNGKLVVASVGADLAMGGTYQVTGLQAPASDGEAIRATTKITEVLLESATDLKHAAVTVSAPISLSTQAISLVNDAVSPATVTAIAIDGTFASNSDTLVPTQKAAKTYADTKTTLAAVKADADVASAISLKHAAITVSAPIVLTGQAIELKNNAGSPAQITAIDVGALADSDTVIPTSKAVTTALAGVGGGGDFLVMQVFS